MYSPLRRPRHRQVSSTTASNQTDVRTNPTNQPPPFSPPHDLVQSSHLITALSGPIDALPGNGGLSSGHVTPTVPGDPSEVTELQKGK